MKHWKFFIGFLLLLHLSACEKMWMEKDPENSPQAVFDQVWNTINERYVYLDYKHIDWDSAKVVCSARIQPEMSDDSLFTVLGDLLDVLKDGHVNLSTPFDRSRYWEWFTGYPANFSATCVDQNYLKPDSMSSSSGLLHRWIGDVGFVAYRSFGTDITSDALNHVFLKYAKGKGLILDIRGNKGGNFANVTRLLSHLVLSRTLVGYTYQKNSPVRNDFSEAEAIYVNPSGVIFLKPVVILINRECYSAASFFCAFASQLPQVTLVGDRAGGGGSAPVSDNLPNGWTYRYSSNFTTLADGFNFENGIDPDIFMSTGLEDEVQGKDRIIEKAVEILH
jgi:hypothetical protein